MTDSQHEHLKDAAQAASIAFGGEVPRVEAARPLEVSPEASAIIARLNLHLTGNSPALQPVIAPVVEAAPLAQPAPAFILPAQPTMLVRPGDLPYWTLGQAEILPQTAAPNRTQRRLITARTSVAQVSPTDIKIGRHRAGQTGTQTLVIPATQKFSTVDILPEQRKAPVAEHIPELGGTAYMATVTAAAKAPEQLISGERKQALRRAAGFAAVAATTVLGGYIAFKGGVNPFHHGHEIIANSHVTPQKLDTGANQSTGQPKPPTTAVVENMKHLHQVLVHKNKGYLDTISQFATHKLDKHPMLRQKLQAFSALRHHFGRHIFSNIKGVKQDNGDLWISRPGLAHWHRGALKLMRHIFKTA